MANCREEKMAQYCTGSRASHEEPLNKSEESSKWTFSLAFLLKRFPKMIFIALQTLHQFTVRNSTKPGICGYSVQTTQEVNGQLGNTNTIRSTATISTWKRF